MTEEPLVRVRHLDVRRGGFLLRVPHWDVPPGIVAGLVGPNGAGKTTLLETLAGFEAKNAGRLEVFGLDPWKHPVSVRTRLGFMSDDMPVFALRVDRLIRFVAGHYRSWDEQLAGELIDRFRIDTRKKAQNLSRGEGTRLRLLLAMGFRPRLLLLDEPALGLDLAGRRALLETVLELVADPSCSVVISSHQLHDVERIADRLLVLDGGIVTAEGETTELVGDHQTLEEALTSWARG